MRKESRILKLSVFLLGVLFLLNFISAVVNLDQPTSDATVTGANQRLNVTVTSFVNVTGCSWYVSSSSTANSTATNISSLGNTSNNQLTFNVTSWNTINLEDANDYSLYASCTNMTSTIQNSTATTVTVNNSIPQAPTSLFPSAGQIVTNASFLISSTITSYNTTQCLLFFVNGPNFGGSPQTMTHTGSECTIALNGTPEQTYKYIVEANDGTNRVNSTETTFQVNTPGSNPKVTQYYLNRGVGEQTESGQTLATGFGGGKVPLIIIVILVIVGIAIWIRKK